MLRNLPKWLAALPLWALHHAPGLGRKPRDLQPDHVHEARDPACKVESAEHMRPLIHPMYHPTRRELPGVLRGRKRHKGH